MARPRAVKAKMSTKKKMSAISAVVLTVALLVGGAFAWTDFGQNFINRFRGTSPNDVLLHDDFEQNVNKDVYVENTGANPLIVRVQFREFLQIGDRIVAGTDSKDRMTWPVHEFTNGAVQGTGAYGEFDDACLSGTHDYYEWLMSGAQKWYMPGVSKQGNYDYTGDPNAAQTISASPVVTMAYWKSMSAADQAATSCWILDTDGWCYWSQMLMPDSATNLLLDDAKLISGVYPDDNYAYFIDVQLQASNKTEVQDMLDEGATPDAEDLLNELAKVDVNKAGLKQSIDKADNMVSNSGNYVQDQNWQDMLDALADANIVYSDAAATQTEVDDAKKALDDAIAKVTSKTPTPTPLPFNPTGPYVNDPTWRSSDPNGRGFDGVMIDVRTDQLNDVNWCLATNDIFGMNGTDYDRYVNGYLSIQMTDLFADPTGVTVALKTPASAFENGVYAAGTNEIKGARAFIDTDGLFKFGYVPTVKEIYDMKYDFVNHSIETVTPIVVTFSKAGFDPVDFTLEVRWSGMFDSYEFRG